MIITDGHYSVWTSIGIYHMIRLMEWWCTISDGKAWKHFNSVHSYFSAESRNVCLGLCKNGFNPFGSFATPYSCWSVILMVYNLAPGMCLRLEFLFLSTVKPGPSSSCRYIDVFLWLLIEELTQWWFSRALTYDLSRK